MKDEQLIGLARDLVTGKEKSLKQIPSSFFQLRIDELDNAFPANRYVHTVLCNAFAGVRARIY